MGITLPFVDAGKGQERRETRAGMETVVQPTGGGGGCCRRQPGLAPTWSFPRERRGSHGDSIPGLGTTDVDGGGGV